MNGLKVPRLLVEFILLGPEDDRRQLQDSPILGDVWVEFARQPQKRLELLITPHREQAAAETANALNQLVPGGGEEKNRTNIAYLQGIVAARLTFDEVIRFVLPMTFWWSESRIADAMKDYLTNVDTLVTELVETRKETENWLGDGSQAAVQDFETRRRFSVLTALLLWAARQPENTENDKKTPKDQARAVITAMQGNEKAIVETLTELFPQGLPPTLDMPYVWTVSLESARHAGAVPVGAGGESGRGADALHRQLQPDRLGGDRFWRRCEALRVSERVDRREDQDRSVAGQAELRFHRHPGHRHARQSRSRQQEGTPRRSS